jgi:hypothetical protein
LKGKKDALLCCGWWCFGRTGRDEEDGYERRREVEQQFFWLREEETDIRRQI